MHVFQRRLFFLILICEAVGTAATPGLLCQPRVIVKMIMEKQMECRLAGETEVLGENLPQRHFCPSQNLTWPDPGLNPGRRGRKPATNRPSYGAAARRLTGGHYRDFLLKAFHHLLEGLPVAVRECIWIYIMMAFQDISAGLREISSSVPIITDAQVRKGALHDRQAGLNWILWIYTCDDT
jgi:hypothetical protein